VKKVYKRSKEKEYEALGYVINGFVTTERLAGNGLSKWLSPLGTVDELEASFRSTQ